MSFMPWNEQFVLGIDSIDKQHRWLVDATNRLHDQVGAEVPDKKVVREILEGLVEYTVDHFILEEDLFHRLGYPETNAHQEEHDTFTRKTIHLLLNFEKDQNITGEALSFLKDWLQHHILQVDKAYAPFLKSHGVN
ncbi:MAG: bacteriohemerythrin [Zoogloeaceae bacterium]|jgi:hemerythrin|nr:bacteriohemerythrin [Zoogloeaceae bacterium]